MSEWFMWFIVFWSIFLITVMFIGGYFMFRKFLKRLPKEDGKSILDWQDHYIQETRHLWPDEKKQLLEELVEPVPELFRDVAREKIAGKIGQLALEREATTITEELIIEGYILATPKRDHKFLRKKLKEKNIDLTTYQHLFS
ncbi:DUF2621 domain-containing protein [Desertibacillus haloalkaliphilus]|uniref:DUF2621 domain-containing protein n=1 Tax=Desertibacillus haloalkaliphilus TaxID=1328930 RepID=UPI001C25EAF9|nr:DUF2621 domain-containing protein [Desertibacillus haloalkaliphilus]MBU8907398.1 DUF2621 domain-containing protein [Desertibacillus haloalkaliphilus]